MILKPVSTLQELAILLPKLANLHHALEGKWEPDLTEKDFLCRLVQNFQNNFAYFADLDEAGEIIYFASIGTAVQTESKKEGFFWLFYMNQKHRENTPSVVEQLKQFMKEQGYQFVSLSTTRLTGSYDRWLTKNGAVKHSLTYRLTLN